MRLLRREEDGCIGLSDWPHSKAPPYAILSHTWGPPKDEVTYDDILKGTASGKKGYQKIEFCEKQAASDGLQYFWVDTCCINKLDSVELAKSINSMFRWYRDAARCYVFLSDVENMADFQQSRWFTRGWTLQELLAPKIVEFFSLSGERLGNKTTLEEKIEQVSKIQATALQGHPLTDFPVQERMNWVCERQTTEEEDIVYCLLGIFDVYLPLIYGEGEAHARLRLMREINRGSSTSSSVLTKEKSRFLVSFGQNDDFVGRDSDLQQLLQMIPPKAKVNDCQRTAIEGLGGIGKTQIALEAAYRVHQQFPECSVFWVPAISQAAFENAYREIGQALQVPGIDDDKADIRTLVKAALNKSVNEWLLVIDNIDDLSLFSEEISLQRYLPFSRHGSILFTTRNHEVTSRLDISHRNIIRITKMSEAEALSMLSNGLQERQLRNEQSTRILLRHLAYLPLAIKQASAYMAQTGFSTTKYLEYYGDTDQKQLEFLKQDFTDRGRYPDVPNAVLTTWLVSFEHISQFSPLAAKLLKFICFLAEKDIPKSILPPGDTKDEMEKDQAIAILEGYAFISPRKDENSFDIHRLVRLAMRNTLKVEDRVETVTNVVRHLSKVYPFPQHENRNVWMGYMPHILTAVEVGQESADKDDTWRLLYNVAETYRITAKYAQAEQMYRQVLELQKEVLGRDHPDTLSSMNHLATVLDNQGKCLEAEQIHQQVLELRKAVLGRDHLYTLSSMNNLALVLDSQGKCLEAEQIHRQVLELRKAVLGRDHPYTLSSMNNLALVLYSQGKCLEAEQIHRQVLELHKAVLGRDHPYTLSSMNNLALVLDSQGKCLEAEQIQRQVLELQKEVLGRDHPDTLSSMNNLALVLVRQGKYLEAEQIHRQVLELRKAVLGQDHPDTFASISGLALAFTGQGKNEESERLQRRALQGCQKILGPKHPQTLASMGHIASVLQKQGQYAQAETIHQQVLTLREEIFGPDHPLTVRSRNEYEACLTQNEDESVGGITTKGGLEGPQKEAVSLRYKEGSSSGTVQHEAGPSKKTGSRSSRLIGSKWRLGKRS
ncbi:hypothetical protein BX600DRAFT_411360 [Xylariales sp. PMI_506]|nr:hypothetical protein BX600DRAFT_411360 [Xylariales sp. PMI_506]